MQFPQSISSVDVRPQDCHTVCGTLKGIAPLHPQSGLVALQLRGADDTEIEVLVDADVAIRQLAAAFGSAEQGVGERIELALDLFACPTLRTSPSRGAGAGGDSCAFRCPKGA